MQSAYTEAIDGARDTIVLRARQYKRLVIAVSIGGLLSLLAAAVLHQLLSLFFFAFLPAAVLLHFMVDLRLVHRWRGKVLAAWVDGELQLDLLAQTLRRIPSLPAQTVEGMLDCLPGWTSSQVPFAVRHALVGAQQVVAGIAEQALALRSVGWGLAAAVALGAWVSERALVLLIWLVPLVAIAAWRAVSRRRLRATCQHLCANWPLPVLDAVALVWLKQLNWQGVPIGHQSVWRAAADERQSV